LRWTLAAGRAEAAIRRLAGLDRALRAALFLVAAGCVGSVHDYAAKGDVAGLERMIAADPGLLESRNRLGKTPLHQAVTSGSTRTVQWLIDRGADVNARDDTGMTPLHVAAWWTSTERAKQLIAAGADLDARDAFGDTPLHVAAMHGRGAMSKYLVAAGADPSARNDEGNTPLDLARRHGYENIAEAFGNSRDQTAFGGMPRAAAPNG
jgi:cytohesin